VTTDAPTAFETVTTTEGFRALADGWDDLVATMARPTPFLLHGWLDAWWAQYGEGARLAVHVACRGGKPIAALPLVLRQRYGLRVAEFLGGSHSELADLLVAPDVEEEVAVELAGRASRAGQDYADLFGLPANSRLARALGPARLRTLERVEAPVLDLERGWGAVYKDKLSSKRRYAYRRKRQKLAERGELAVAIARTWDEVEPALEDGFRLHALRWAGRPDRSGFVTPRGMRFYRDGYRALSDQGVARIITLKVNGRAIAFHSYFIFRNTAYSDRLGFDPELARFSPGFLNTLDWLEAAAAEGVRRVEFLGGTEEYKLVFADRVEPLYVGLGLAASLKGQAVVNARLAGIRARKRLKRSERLRRLYFEGLGPVRRLGDRLRRPAREA
jgi:CelD/BcsL family acetyltransferase involved in cellulose biosynthesis